MRKNPYRKIYLLIIALSVLMMLVVLNLPFKAKPFGDITFHEEAKNLALFLKGEVPSSEVMITKAPGPVVFFTVPYLIAPSDATDNQLWYYGITWTGIFITLAMLLIFRTAQMLFSDGTAILTMVLFFIFPLHYYYSLGIIGEGAAFFSLSLMLYGWARAWRNPASFRAWSMFAGGFLFLILNRPNTMLFFGFVALVMIYAAIKNKLFLRKFGKQMIVCFSSAFILGFAGLQLAKKITGGDGDAQDNLLYWVALQGRYQFREEPTDFRFWDNEERPDSKDYQNWVKCRDSLHKIIGTGKKYKDVYRQFFIDDALEHPGWFVRQFFVKALYGHVYMINSIKPHNFKMGPLQGPSGFWTLIAVINLVNIVILAGVLLFIFRQGNQFQYWPLWSIILSLLIFHSLTYMEPRYLFPSKPALYILGAAGLMKIGAMRRISDIIAQYLIR